jgi:hypothetical protein
MMKQNPYSHLPKPAFWKTGVAHENPYWIQGIYKKKFTILPQTKIATAGSCFAQHITRHLKVNGFQVLDAEPPPPGLPEDKHQDFGFSMYSARYGNVYSVRQLLQLAQEASGEWTPQDYVWMKNDKYIDGLRPAVEPRGLDSPEEVKKHRLHHISRVRELFRDLDLLIFTLGLTEMWVHKDSGTVYPTAPGAIAGEFDETIHEFQNARFNDIIRDFRKFQDAVRRIRGGKPFRILLTVSPVPLTATASGKHILQSTSYSKSVLRAAAEQLSAQQGIIDYFPSFEIVTNPRLHSTSFSENLRSVRKEAVENVMDHFFREHQAIINRKDCVSSNSKSDDGLSEDFRCEEALLEAFSE